MTYEEKFSFLENMGVNKLAIYKALGFTEKAFDDEDWQIRLAAYHMLGFTEKALDDEDWSIRLAAYRALGFTEKALDKDFQEYFRAKKLLENEEEKS